MSMPPGVYTAYTKDNTKYYRASITYKNKHISLGSYADINEASNAYHLADKILHNTVEAFVNTSEYTTSYSDCVLSFEKWLILVNFRDCGIYFKTPIYLCQKYFIYFLNQKRYLIFDTDDLFYYSNHKIMSRNGYLFVNDYGMQTSILSRFGIKTHAVLNRDYCFVNGDKNDYRYANISIINQYFGVTKIINKGLPMYRVKIHINGDYIVGTYNSEQEAAIAYNKAIDILRTKGVTRNYKENYIEDITHIQYAAIYNSVKLSKKIRNYKL